MSVTEISRRSGPESRPEVTHGRDTRSRFPESRGSSRNTSESLPSGHRTYRVVGRKSFVSVLIVIKDSTYRGSKEELTTVSVRATLFRTVRGTSEETRGPVGPRFGSTVRPSPGDHSSRLGLFRHPPPRLGPRSNTITENGRHTSELRGNQKNLTNLHPSDRQKVGDRCPEGKPGVDVPRPLESQGGGPFEAGGVAVGVGRRTPVELVLTFQRACRPTPRVPRA